ncbi:MAG: ATP-binding protein [Acidobacteriota bacterium]
MPSQTPKGRFLFLVPALLLTIFVAGLAGVGFQRKMAESQTLGVQLAPRGEGFWVAELLDASVGLEAGDVIVTARGDQPTSLGDLEARLRAAESVPLLVQRGDSLVQVNYSRPPRTFEPIYPILATVGVFYLLIGLYTSLKGRRAELFVLWSLASAAFFLLSPRVPPSDTTDLLIFLVDQGARTLLPALTLHLFLFFPKPLLSRRAAAFAVPGLYLPAAFLLAFHGDQALFGGAKLFGPATLAQVHTIDRLELLVLLACVLASAAALVLRLKEPGEWQQRRQVLWILAGLVAGYVPFLIFYAAPFALGWPTPLGTTLAAVLPLALVPLAFAYAIFKYKLLDLGLILRDAVSYSAAAVVGVFGFQTAQVVIDQGIGEELAVARTMLTFAAGLVVAGVLAPTKNAVASGLERWQHRGLWSRRRLLQSLGRELLHERDLDRLCRRLTEQLSDALVVRAEMYMLGKDGALHRTEGPARALAAGAEDQEPTPAEDLSLLQTLEVDALGRETWRRDVNSISPVGLPSGQIEAPERLFTAGYRYAFPILVQQQPVGLIVMSYKYDELPLDGEDLELVRGLLNQAALAIENARLFVEVRRQLAEVSRLEAYSQGILHSSPAALAVLDPEDRILTANPSFLQLFGVDSDSAAAELEGRSLADYLPVSPLPEVGAGLTEASYCEPSGTERYLQLSLASYDLAGTSGRRVLVVQDVSERVSMELELREKEHMASLGMLAAGVAHEVNTPLTGISSYAQFMLDDTEESDPRFKILKKMERQTFRASQIVNNLLDFSRNRRGEMSRVDLGSVVTDAVQLLEMRATKSDAALHCDALVDSSSGCLEVLGNEGELHQVVTNLLTNALDAVSATPGDRRVVASVERMEREKRLRVSVSDNGPGIPPERLDTIFKPFFSSKLGRGGTGLGLAITYNLVRRHGGEIRAENHETSAGCTFSVELPVYQAVAG